MGVIKVPEVPIESVHELLKWVEDFEAEYGQEFRHTNGGVWPTYRGHSDKRYMMVPGLFRKEKGTPRFYTHEQLMIQETLRLMPESFRGFTAFQTLAKLQHYNLPTRLLDITTNPLVALYFASGGKADIDGEVVVIPRTPVLGEDAAQVRVLCEWAINGDWNFRTGEDIARASNFSLSKEDQAADVRTLVGALTSHFVAVRPSYTNDRLRAQGGAFLIAGMQLVEPKDVNQKDAPFNQKVFSFKPWVHDPVQDSPIKIAVEKHYLRFIVPGRSKMKIRRQLDRLEINEATLFPDPEHRARYIAEGYRNGAFGKAIFNDG